MDFRERAGARPYLILQERSPARPSVIGRSFGARFHPNPVDISWALSYPAAAFGQTVSRFGDAIMDIMESDSAAKQPPPQQDLISFLLKPKSYPHCPKSVHLIQTHASLIAMVPPYVYKIKKPVNFGFLDFSTLEKRRHFCEQEVLLNRRLCPDLYLGVVPISFVRTGLVFGAGGCPVEYAVQMRKLPDRYFMIELLRQRRLGKKEINRVLSKLKAFYQNQSSTPKIRAWGALKKIRLSTDENFDQTKCAAGEALSHAAYEALRTYTASFYRNHAEQFHSRRVAGRILDCHGDLHLEHVHITPERVCIYDCIEFNERFRYIDVANDLAFLAMDLDFHGRPDLSIYLAVRMARLLQDPGLLEILTFYKVYRAYVRGKVEFFRSRSQGPSKVELNEAETQARRYFQLALRYAVTGSPSRILLVMGQIGSGKTALATALARELGWPCFSSDRERKALAGIPVHEPSAPSIRSWLYSEEITKRTYDLLLRKALREFRQGNGAVIDATFSSRTHRERFRASLDRAGTSACFIEVHAPKSIVRKRLEARDHQSEGISDARLADFDKLHQRYETPAELPANQRIQVSSASSISETLRGALRKLVKTSYR